ncbi:DUF222 domain-containing protein [Geodermatophilus sp. CPCC 206100]|uniref:DUF222 domain-containing protein n=1 Tax=Geodermatophilus sp. CPCC 206100 TaxID=3020054 RepID=UPI003B00D523
MAIRARAVAAFAATRPASGDRAPGQPGAMSAERWAARPEVLRSVSEWATPELSIACNLSVQAAEELLERSLILVHRLPATLAALEAGRLHAGHLWHLLDKVAPIDDPRLRAQVEAELLAWLARRTTVTTPAQLGDKARRVLARRDARAAAGRLAAALRERGVHLRSDRAEGMAALTVVCTMPEAQALYRALGACADALPAIPGEARTRGQQLVDCLLDLVLRPGQSELPPVQVLLTVVASLGTLLGGDTPGEVEGQVVPAEMIRRLLHALTGHHPADADHPAAAEPAATAPDGDAGDVPWQQAEQAELERWWAEMERRVLTDELGPGPDPGPDPTCRPPDAADLPDVAGGSAVDARAAAWPRTDTLAPDDPTPDGCSAPGAGWWASADRAVHDAGEAVHAAAQALGRARRLVRIAQAADVADETTWRAGPHGRIDAAPDALTALAAATTTQRDQLADLLTATAGGGLADRPRLALTDALTGALRALTDLPTLQRTASCGAPACRRSPTDCTTTSPAAPAWAPRHPPPTTGPAPPSTGSSAPATAAAASPAAAARCPAAANWTTTGPGPPAPPARPTSPATAPPTTAANTRPPAGTTTSPPTAPSPSPPPPG